MENKHLPSCESIKDTCTCRLNRELVLSITEKKMLELLDHHWVFIHKKCTEKQQYTDEIFAGEIREWNMEFLKPRIDNIKARKKQEAESGTN